VLADVPVVPDAETARRWATEELADPAYHRSPSLLDRLLEWLGSLFDGASSLSLPPVAVVVTVVLVLLLVLAVAFWVAGPVRASRRGTASVVVLGDDTRTADQLRAAADDAAARGDWATAVLERFRAVVRSLEERAVLLDAPGRTADEAAEAAGARLPAHTTDLRRAARLFDDVCYGQAAVDAGADAWMRTLDRQVADTRPVGQPAPVEAR
jgi:phage-related minor tail protein